MKIFNAAFVTEEKYSIQQMKTIGEEGQEPTDMNAYVCVSKQMPKYLKSDCW